MFYELNTWDPLGLNPWKRSQQNPLQGTFEGSVNEFAQITLLMDPNAQFSDQALMSNTPTASIAASKMALLNNAVVTGVEVPNILPDG
jgi:hypothetical protein